MNNKSPFVSHELLSNVILLFPKTRAFWWQVILPSSPLFFLAPASSVGIPLSANSKDSASLGPCNCPCSSLPHGSKMFWNIPWLFLPHSPKILIQWVTISIWNSALGLVFELRPLPFHLLKFLGLPLICPGHRAKVDLWIKAPVVPLFLEKAKRYSWELSRNVYNRWWYILIC